MSNANQQHVLLNVRIETKDGKWFKFPLMGNQAQLQPEFLEALKNNLVQRVQTHGITIHGQRYSMDSIEVLAFD